TDTAPPDNSGLCVGHLPLFWYATHDPHYNPLTVNYDTDIPLVTAGSPAVNNSTDIGAFIDRGGKLIFYHGLSDSGPPWPYTYDYFKAVEKQHGGLAGASELMKMYLIPNMGHCVGNAATDRFYMLLPMVDWVETCNAPESIVRSGI